MQEKSFAVLCPKCGGKTHTHILKQTSMDLFPLFCPKCKKETIVNVSNGVVSVSLK